VTQRTLTVAIPSRNRPEKLAKCLAALEAARAHHEFDAVVCDSSSGEAAQRSERAVAAHPWARYVHHDLVGPCAARNLGARQATGELLAYVDDDVYVEPEAIARLADAVDADDVVVAGTLDWGDHWSEPQVMRRIGYARAVQPGEAMEWVISAVLCMPRRLVLEVPWDDDRRYYDDRMTCLLWRRAGARLTFVPSARAHHDDERKPYPLAQERHRIYANLYDAIFLRRSLSWILSYELLGFAASAKAFGRTPRGALGIVVEWLRGNARFLADFPRLVRGEPSVQSRP
jgi:glycosyltransferase involved in cell wall biosynthesis